jgi:CheY-like chemotaxis protein
MSARILIADDNPADIEFFELAFDDLDLHPEFLIAKDGREALALLEGEQPALALLDIKMPKLTGFEVLQAIRATPRMQHLPVIVMSSSMAAQDRQRATQLGAMCYWVKPSIFSDAIALVKTLPGLVPALRPVHEQ